MQTLGLTPGEVLMLREGDRTTVTVAFLADYALWGRTAQGELGVVPFEEEDDLDADEAPFRLGQQVAVRVVRLLNPVGQEQHSDLTLDGRIRRVDFLGRLDRPALGEDDSRT